MNLDDGKVSKTEHKNKKTKASFFQNLRGSSHGTMQLGPEIAVGQAVKSSIDLIEKKSKARSGLGGTWTVKWVGRHAGTIVFEPRSC